jgi:hypothetical protein
LAKANQKKTIISFLLKLGAIDNLDGRLHQS